jgi:hypothetical protein
MDDPKRLIEELGSGFERDLLRLGSAERAPEGARDRVAASLFGVAVAAPLVIGPEAAAAAGAGGSGSAGSLLGAAIKWLSIGAVAGAASTAVGVAIERRLDATNGSDAAALERQAASSPAFEATTGVKRAESALVDRAQQRSVPPDATDALVETRGRKPARGAVWIGSPATTLESQSLARIRTLAERDPKRSLELLDEHDARFPRHLAAHDTRALREQIRAKRAR